MNGAARAEAARPPTRVLRCIVFLPKLRSWLADLHAGLCIGKFARARMRDSCLDTTKPGQEADKPLDWTQKNSNNGPKRRNPEAAVPELSASGAALGALAATAIFAALARGAALALVYPVCAVAALVLGAVALRVLLMGPGPTQQLPIGLPTIGLHLRLDPL